jgi:hypothetical protein
LPLLTVAHAEFLRQEGGDDLAVEQVEGDWRKMDLSAAEYAMLEVVERLTLTPSNMREADARKLRRSAVSRCRPIHGKCVEE